MHVDPILPTLALVCLVVLGLGLLLNRLRQPALLAYLLVGVLLGPHALGVVTDEALMSHLGGIGVVLLLFFVGMEIKPERLLANGRVVLLGTTVQILASVGCVLGLGAWLDWPVSRSILIGFVISLSSTVMVLRLLQHGRAAETRVGEQVTGILLAQDIAIVPMLVVLGLMRGEAPDFGRVAIQIVGALLFLTLFVWIARRGELRLGIGRLIGRGHELQVFAALIVAVGLSLLSDLAGLSTALGALLAGMVISAAKETHWVHESLEPFRVVFVALFFLSIGMLLDLRFLADHWALVLALTVLAFLTNTFINLGILRVFGSSWRQSLYGGALLAQIGELSYVVAAVGRQAAIVSDFAYQATVCMITLTLLASPFWAAAARALARPFAARV